MTKTNGLAISSMILGILSLFLFWIPIVGFLLPLLALILGIVSLRKISKNESAGKAFSIVGIVLGALFLIVGLLISFASLALFGALNFDKSLPTTCVFNSQLECGSDFEINSNGQVNFDLKNTNSKKITLTKISMIEKSLSSSGTKCVSDINTEILSNELKNINLNFNDVNCGISNNKGQTKSFDIEITYFNEGSSIPLISFGQITTKVK